MLKYSTLMLLIAVAISWSCADANPMPRLPVGKRSAPSYGKRAIDYKRSTEDEVSSESQEKLVKELLVGLLLIAADTSTEERALTDKFKEAMDQDWDSLDDFAKHVVGAYEEVTRVTGEKFDSSSESDETE